MLSIGLLAAGGESYYLAEVATGTEDYYTQGEAPGQWVGAGPGLLGLAGTVEPDNLHAVLAGLHPATNTPLATVASRRARPGFDLTFSSPKGVSLIASLADPDVAATVRRCHDRAVAQALGYLEEEACWARRSHAGAELVEARGLVAAAFVHRASRAADPQLHTHVLVANVVSDESGRWSAPDSRSLFRHARTAGFVYQAALRAELTESLGLRWGPVRNGLAEVAGFTTEQLREFSRRRADIEAALEAHGATSARAAQIAALGTRTPKDPTLTTESLHQSWQRRGQEVGITPEVIAAALGPARPAGIDAATAREWAAELLGPDGLTANVSTFERRDVVRAVAQRCGDGATVARVGELADQVLADPAVVALAEGTWTTAELLGTERACIAGAVGRRHANTTIVTEDTVARVLAERPALTGEQQVMVRRLVTSDAGVEVVVGQAGTGKTFALDAARAAWQAEGIEVIGCALAARAALELQAGSGIASVTLDRLLLDLDDPEARLGPRTAIVVDEAAMVGTRKLARLLAHAERAGARVVLCGDHHQLPEIAAGGCFAQLAHRLDAVHLVENRRQAEPWERAALAELRSGDVAVATATAEVAVPFDFVEAGHLTHAYATTVHKAQGSTVSRAFVLGSDALCREAGYSALSRARERTDLYVVAGDTVDLEGHARPEARSAVDELVGRLARSQAKELAVARAVAPLPCGPTLADLLGERDRIAARVLAASGPSPTQAPPGPEELERFVALGGAIHERQRLLGRAAVVDPPAHLVAELGPAPAPAKPRAAWARAAQAVEAYRDAHGVDGPDPLGPRPEGRHQIAEYDTARRAIDDAARRLGRTPEHDLARSI